MQNPPYIARVLKAIYPDLDISKYTDAAASATPERNSLCSDVAVIVDESDSPVVGPMPMAKNTADGMTATLPLPLPLHADAHIDASSLERAGDAAGVAVEGENKKGSCDENVATTSTAVVAESSPQRIEIDSDATRTHADQEKDIVKFPGSRESPLQRRNRCVDGVLFLRELFALTRTLQLENRVDVCEQLMADLQEPLVAVLVRLLAAPRWRILEGISPDSG